MKKWLKIWLIVWWSVLVAWWARAWLTKTWVIPNWLDIGILCPENNKKTSNDSACTCFVGPSDLPHCPDCHYDPYTDYKPIIYLYPIEKGNISVILWNSENLLHTYPKYDTNKWWNVIAQPNWDLKDFDSGRKLYALYREWKSDIETNFNEWFVVAWRDIIPFLEEKLEILWLNEREAEEFIVYWLPQMEVNEWNLIRFETIEEQNENMPLNITPKPDTLIRVMMDWKAIDEPMDIPEQHLTTPERNGFTVVERWWSPRN